MARRRERVAMAAGIALATLSPVMPASAVEKPPANAPFDYQIGGAYPPADEVRVVVRDRLAAPEPGRYNVCYVNAFQTQPDEGDWWLQHHPDLLVRSDGAAVTDPHWPREYVLDTSTSAKRAALLAIVGAWIDGCARDGFDAVEPDNLDSWLRSHGGLSPDDNLAFAALLVERAHAAGLAIAQKNASEYAAVGASRIGFDFAIVESCQVWNECGAYIAAYGDHVYAIEYDDSARDANGDPAEAIGFFREACRRHGDRIAIAYRDRGVSPPGRPGHVARRC